MLCCCRRSQDRMDSDGTCSEAKDVPENSEWMSKLPEKIHTVPLNCLSIPGSHDSFAYYLDKSGPLAADTPAAIVDLEKLFGALVKDIVYRWSKTQSLDATAQLKAGIRYFDIRVSPKPNSEDLFIVHGLFGEPIETIFAQLLYFLEEHPKEVIFLDFNHFYCMNENHHDQLVSTLYEFFGSKICAPTDVETLTLESLWQNNHQVLLFYHYAPAVSRYDQLWPGNKMVSPWPNQVSVSKLIASLNEEYDKERPMVNSAFFVFQGVLTPDGSYVLLHLSDTLKNCLCDKICKPFVNWMDSKMAGLKGINFTISDFVEEANYIPSVIELNMKYAKSL